MWPVTAAKRKWRLTRQRIDDDGPAVWLSESVFRAGPQGVDDAVAALRKVYENREDLAAKAEELMEAFRRGG